MKQLSALIFHRVCVVVVGLCYGTMFTSLCIAMAKRVLVGRLGSHVIFVVCLRARNTQLQLQYLAYPDPPLVSDIQMQLMREMYQLGEFISWGALLPHTKQRLRDAEGLIPREDSRAFW